LPTPVVFITAFDDDATRNEAIAVGCIDYLLKPFDATRLAAALERDVAQPRHPRSSSESTR
jgi:response regulator of citrate/malate metabolism